MKILLFSLLFSLPCFALTEADFTWEIASEHENITVYRANPHSSGIVPIKAQTVFPFSISHVLSLIADTSKKTTWVPYLAEGRILEGKSPYERVEYARYESPWPFNDRVFVLEVKGNYDKKTKTVAISLNSVLHPSAPLDPQVVRGDTYMGSIKLKNNGPAETWFEIVLLSDFKGNIPTWIINLVQAKWPFKMFKLMNERLSHPDFRPNPEYSIKE